jgi:hypothetical protein
MGLLAVVNGGLNLATANGGPGTGNGVVGGAAAFVLGWIAATAGALALAPLAKQFPEVRLIPPSASGFILLAAQVDRHPPLLGSSARKRKLLHACKRLCLDLRRERDVLDCTVFRAILVPPGSGGPYLQRRGSVHQARFDVVVLVEVATVQLVDRILESEPYRALDRCVRDAAGDVYQTKASNVKRIGPVDHSRDGVFLFNFFVADRTEQNIAVWHQTAGWFQQETGLDNSTVLLPLPAYRSPYTIINHCRWNRLRDVLPALIFKRSFRTYVLAHFDANDTAPMPILYRLA